MSQHLKADLLLVMVTILAAAGWIFSNEALQGLSPIVFIGSRFLLAGLVVAAVGHRALRQLRSRDFVRTALVGLVFSVALVFWIMGLALGQHLGVGAFLSSLGVVFVPVLALFLGDRASWTTWLALPVAAAGLACLSLDSEFVIGTGEYAFMAAAFLFAFYFTLNSRAAARTSPIALTAVQLTVVGLVTLPFGLAIEGTPDTGDLHIWDWFLASVFIATAGRFFLQTRAQSMAPASHTALIMILEPVWTALLAALWYGETMTLMQFSGCALILLALLTTRAAVLRQLLGWVRHRAQQPTGV